jgi:hypothetical protein
MSLEQWLENSWIRPTERSAEEVANLLSVAQREIADASLPGISADGGFEHSYAAVQALCQLALHAAGYEVPKGENKHQRTIEALRFTLGGEWAGEVDYFDHCRRMRHQLMYDRAGIAQQADVDELLDAAKRLYAVVKEWLKFDHSDLMFDE